jgi:hypothetical protein
VFIAARLKKRYGRKLIKISSNEYLIYVFIKLRFARQKSKQIYLKNPKLLIARPNIMIQQSDVFFSIFVSISALIHSTFLLPIAPPLEYENAKRSHNHEITHLKARFFPGTKKLVSLQGKRKARVEVVDERGSREWTNVKIHFVNQINFSSLIVKVGNRSSFPTALFIHWQTPRRVATRFASSRIFLFALGITLYLHRIAVSGRHVYCREIGSPKRNLASDAGRPTRPTSVSREARCALKFDAVRSPL